jgi:hypothetical protein
MLEFICCSSMIHSLEPRGISISTCCCLAFCTCQPDAGTKSDAVSPRSARSCAARALALLYRSCTYLPIVREVLHRGGLTVKWARSKSDGRGRVELLQNLPRQAVHFALFPCPFNKFNMFLLPSVACLSKVCTFVTTSDEHFVIVMRTTRRPSLGTALAAES